MNPLLLGSFLLSQPFEIWLRFLFKKVESRPFVVENVHRSIFETYENIFNMNEDYTFTNLNLPPRSGKTIIAEYFLIYCLLKAAINKKGTNWIYISYSIKLLKEVSSGIKNIVESQIFKLLYGDQYFNIHQSDIEFTDDAFEDYYKSIGESKEVIKFSSTDITLGRSRIVLSPLGGQITGFGAGVRGGEDYVSGGIFLDDINKIQDTVRSELLREKTRQYFSGVIFSRRNNPKVLIMNIQQRVHIEDMTGYLEDTYNFKTIKAPLIGETGICQIPSQYDQRTIDMLKKDNFTFQAQYQQDPILEGGYLIKTDFIKRFEEPLVTYKQMFIVCDTAFSEKKSSDFSVFGLFGIDEKNNIWLVEGYCKRVSFPDLKRDLRSFYLSAVYKFGKYNNISTIYVENKGSGISLIQQLREDGLPIKELSPTYYNAEFKKEEVSDKYTRFLEISADIESGYFYMPREAHFLMELIRQCESFTGGKQSYHDDWVDVLIYALKIRRKNIQDIDWQNFGNIFR
ncbi:MAG: phage terminase large subunit [Alphaproteobacteria bacterium]